jgi:hypothetical protein
VDIIFSTSLPSHPHPSSIHFELHSNWGMTGVWLHALLIWSRWGCSGVEIDWLHELWYGVILQSYYWMRSVFQMYGELFEKCWRLPWHPAQLRMIWFGLYEWNQRSQLSPWRSLLTMWAILHVLISPLHSPFNPLPSKSLSLPYLRVYFEPHINLTFLLKSRPFIQFQLEFMAK